MTTKNASRTPVEGWGDIDWEQVYLDALEIDSKAPGTVCVHKNHYVRDHRHPVPYRMGYCHRYRLPDEHYHRTHAELEKCDEENYDR